MEAPLLDRALKALERSSGICGQSEQNRVELAWRGHAQRFRAEVKTLVRPSHLPLLREQPARPEALPPLLVTRQVSAPLADQLRAGGVNFVDAAGNAYVETASWMVWVSGRAAESARPERSTVSRSMWQVAYVLLRGGAEGLTVRELGQRAGVSHGTAANALAVFERHGWLLHLAHAHPLSDPDGLLRAWEFGYQDRLLRALDVGRAVAPAARTLQAWGEGIGPQLGLERGLLGGELAAERSGADIVATTATLHLPRWDAETMRALRLAPANDGPIFIRQMFGTVSHDPEHPSLADPLLVRAELMALADDRLDGARAELRRRIERRWSK